ncbi:MAG: hypothetical protein E2P02_29020 [Acidobacteria bacterium]|nr:MAG: hypothetical protein E2P02_29020 [Acidobacteriota bacterium]
MGARGRGRADNETESTEAFVEQDELAVLRQCPREIERAALAVRKLPARIADELVHPTGHPPKCC